MVIDLINKFRTSTRKLILLDYDGTLVNYESTPERARPTEQLLGILGKLANRPGIRLVIITGRESRSIETLVGHLPIDIVAEHGAMIRVNSMWKHETDHDPQWQSDIIPVLEKYTAICPGSFIEKKQFALTWHYRMTDVKTGLIQSRNLIAELKPAIRPHDLKLIDGNKVLEVVCKQADKGIAAKKLLAADNYDFILAIGDDKTDEDMFKSLKHTNNCYTIKVGSGETFADLKLLNVPEVLLFLGQL